jgi:hypothetical protein
MPNDDTEFVRACLAAVAPTLSPVESIIDLAKGQTAYAQQTYLYYKIIVATFVGNTGNSPVNLRSVCVAVNVDEPDSASLVPISYWRPLDLPKDVD